MKIKALLRTPALVLLLVITGFIVSALAKQKQDKPIVFIIGDSTVKNGSGNILRASDDYGKWAAEAAAEGGAFFVDLNEIIAAHYEELGQEKIRSEYFLEDHTHTTKVGAILNASSVVEGLKELKDCGLNDYLK